MNEILRNLIIAALGLAFLNSCQTGGSLSDVDKPKLFVVPQSKVVEKKKIAAVKKVEEVQKIEKVGDVLFGLKQWVVKSEYKEMLKNTLGKIQDKENTKILLCGHTDERGAPKYNLLLGEKRAYSVKFFLIKLGFLKDNIKIKSYGEVKAAAAGRNEEAWRQNRRVEIQIQ